MIDLVPNVAKPFRLPQHEQLEDAPTFMLRSLTARTFLELSAVENPGTSVYLCALAALVGGEGVQVGGEPLKWDEQPTRLVETVHVPGGGIAAEALDKLPSDWIAAIAREARDRHQVTPDDLGK